MSFKQEFEKHWGTRPTAYDDQMLIDQYEDWLMATKWALSKAAEKLDKYNCDNCCVEGIRNLISELKNE